MTCNNFFKLFFHNSCNLNINVLYLEQMIQNFPTNLTF